MNDDETICLGVPTFFLCNCKKNQELKYIEI